MGFFDFITQIPPYSESATSNVRLNKRHAMIVEPYREVLKDARVLDLAAHDGRWSYALAGAGAAEVIGIEARQNLIDRFALFPESEFKSRVSLRQGDIFEALEEFIEDGEEFDVVAVYGIFYHIMDHFRLLKLIKMVGAKIILIDSEFMPTKGPTIQLMFESTERDINAAPQISGQERAVIGIPSPKALTVMARALNFDVIWGKAELHFGHDQRGVQDYFRVEGKRRGFCALVELE